MHSIHLYLNQVNVFFNKLLVLGIKLIIPQILDQFFTFSVHEEVFVENEISWMTFSSVLYPIFLADKKVSYLILHEGMYGTRYV